MRQASPQMIALLNENTFKFADLYTVTLINGTTYRYTNCDFDLIVAGHVYTAGDILISRDTISQSIGINVDNLDISIISNDNVLFDGRTILQAFRQGVFDGAIFKLDRVFMDINTPTDTSAGTITLFEGTIVEPQIDNQIVRASVVSLSDKLKVKMPRNLYQPSCQNSLFDNGCTLDSELFLVNGSAETGSTKNYVVCSLAKPQGWFSQGVILFTSGPNVGLKRTVRLHNSTGLLLTSPLENTVSAGDTFKVYPGCDKRIDTCVTRFNNIDNFKGTPYVPIPETSV